MSRQSTARALNRGSSGGGNSGWMGRMVGSLIQGSELSNPNFDPEGIGAVQNPGDVDPDIYAGQNMDAYKGLSPVEIANTPFQPVSEFAGNLGNDANRLNAEYKLSGLDQKARFAHDKEMLSLRGKADSQSAQEAAKAQALAQLAIKNNLTLEQIADPANAAVLQQMFSSGAEAQVAEDNLKTTGAKQKTTALTADKTLIPRELAADVRQKEGNAAQASWRRTVPGTSDIMLKPNGFPTSLSITQGLPLEEDITMTIGGQQFPTGKTRSTMQRPIMQGIPLNEFGEDTPAPVNRPTTIGSPYPQLNAAPRGITQPQQPVNKPTTAEPSTEDINEIIRAAAMGDINAKIKLRDWQSKHPPARQSFNPNGAFAPNIPFHERVSRMTYGW